MKNFKTFYENIIVNHIDLEAYDLSNDINLYDKINTVYNIFKSEYLYENNIKRYRTEENCFKNWLMGLPSVLTVPFYNYEILEKAEEYSKGVSETLHWYLIQNDDDFLNDYWQNLAYAFFTLKENL